MRFPYIRSEPATKAKRQRSVFGFTRFLIASWIYYTLLHPETVIQYIIIDPEPDLTLGVLALQRRKADYVKRLEDVQ
jgi:hypothetical protein